jgi:type I protein arginine methyltransferase
MYSVGAHGKMLADKIRTDAYVEALRRSVKPGSVVADIGTGTGFFAMLAREFGAKSVYAIEPANIIQLAKEIAEANQLGSRIEFIQNLSTEVDLPERADVIVSDLRGILPLFRNHIPSIIDARQRHLSRGGVLIPQQDEIWVSIVEDQDLYHKWVSPWNEPQHGLDLQAAQKRAVNAWRKARLQPSQLLVEAQRLSTLNYHTITDSDIESHVHWTLNRSGTGHGLVIWFDSVLLDGITFTNRPGGEKLIYGSAFFPFAQAISVKANDSVSVSVIANLINDDYVWRWKTSVQDGSGRTVASFNQSTFFSEPLSAEDLRKQASCYVPRVDGEGAIDRFVLERMDGQNSLAEISNQLLLTFPQSFSTVEQALARAGRLSQKYSV